ncbi:cytochrome c family protein [Mesorhizobium sp. M0006]|uniref:c-type cytochrome n=1 Tax=Mesorhizobium sp. M0006 TaxID=2956838 RepID=UPI0033382B25
MSLRNSRSLASPVLATLACFMFVPAASADSGSAIFKRYCSVCHSVEEGKNKIGPSLAGVVGRHSASIETFSYSSAMKGLGVVWTPDNLDKFLTRPASMVPGTMMAFPGVKKDDDRKALIEYLANPGS